MKVSVIGAGLAGSECAYKLAQLGINVDLYEMKPQKRSPAHSQDTFAELVCSNSLKAARIDSAAGLLKEEMRLLGSICIESARLNAVAAGGALAVDRNNFSDYITTKIKENQNINIIEVEVKHINDGIVVIATGPLTSQALSSEIESFLGSNGLCFFDAAAPIVETASIDMQTAFLASRYAKGDDDYINCPMNKQEYEIFYNELVNAESVELKEFEKNDFKVYEGCMPIEVMAKRGIDTIRFGPLKPVGLRDPRTDTRPWAVVQLRKENTESTMYNMVGFQTNLKFAEQKRVFSLIPGLQNAQFVRYGVMHRNTFIDSPRLLDSTFCLKTNPNIYFAGQITGVEGYMESAASGIYVAINIARKLASKPTITLPVTTMIGALAHYISDESVMNFQPMGSNMGILPPLLNVERDKKVRYMNLANRSIEEINKIIKTF
ncbi:MAG: methylenetetrahydrofolate--tRNA-(uracil(54)-C(5))-methyltransferase (FADH(2)-oxidizing) TrmFO [Oscillospiraceae bacterium]